MLQRLLARLVSGQMIFVGVGCGRDFMGLDGNIVQLCGSIFCVF